MAAIPSSTHIRSSAVSYPTQTTIFQFPCETAFLENYCKQINESSGREERYLKLLSSMKQAIFSSLTIENAEYFRENFSSITQIMPAEIKKRTKISSVIENIEKELISEYCYQINQTRGHRSALYQSYFEKIRKSLNDASDHAHVLKLERELRLIKDKLPEALRSRFEDKISKCSNFCNTKFLMLSFISRQQVTANTHKSAASTSSSSSKVTSKEEILDSERERPRSISPILSIDGGGIRGIIPATMLVEIEKITSQPISKLFNLIGGTSTGGILALGLTKPHEGDPGRPQYTAQDLLDLYTLQHDQIFQHNPNYQDESSASLRWHEKIPNAIQKPKYLSLLPLFSQKLGNSTLSSALTDVLITANSLEEIGSKLGSVTVSVFSGIWAIGSALFGNPHPSIWSHDSLPRTVHLFTKRGLSSLSYRLGDIKERYGFSRKRSYSFIADQSDSQNLYSMYQEREFDFPISFVAGVTSAAPTFFPPVRFDNRLFMDGGILQNNPAIPCIYESLEKGYRRESLFMLSLGTGIEPRGHVKSDLSSSLVSLWFQTTQPDFETEQAPTNMLSAGAYHRFQYRFTRHAPELDDTRPETIKMLEEAGHELVEENSDYLREVVKILKPGSI